MMLPATTACPPNFFTPRRLLSLSRPLRDEPPAFLCAMSNYFAFGDFLAPPLAGAAFSVDPASALALAGAAFFVAALGAPAALSLFGAGFSVGVPATSPACCCAAVVSAVSFARAAADLSAPALGEASDLVGAFFASPSALLGTCL